MSGSRQWNQVCANWIGTLEAALADPDADADEALRSGQLVPPIGYSGLGPVDLSGALATSGPRSTARALSPGSQSATLSPMSPAIRAIEPSMSLRSRMAS